MAILDYKNPRLLSGNTCHSNVVEAERHVASPLGELHLEALM